MSINKVCAVEGNGERGVRDRPSVPLQGANKGGMVKIFGGHNSLAFRFILPQGEDLIGLPAVQPLNF